MGILWFELFQHIRMTALVFACIASSAYSHIYRGSCYTHCMALTATCKASH